MDKKIKNLNDEEYEKYIREILGENNVENFETPKKDF